MVRVEMGGTLILVLALIGCSGSSMSDEELQDPANCVDCHPAHVDQWSGSMHAYAGDDPVFLAMNDKGQDETNGELGDFCVTCHAPVALRLGLTQDGTNLGELPAHLRGVTCYSCHLVDAVEGTHNNPLSWATDRRLRGGIADPVDSPHRSAWSPLHDGSELGSSDMCGSCHDIVLPGGLHLERTYQEWQNSIFAVDFQGSLSCGSCHMHGRTGAAATTEGAPERRVHDHGFPGIDTALIEWPNRAEQLDLVQRELDGTLLVDICARDQSDGLQIEVLLDNLGAGHGFPSGATMDRRAWLELTAYRGDEVVWQTGVVGDDEVATQVAAADTDMWLLHDTMFDSAGQPTHDFWEAASIEGEVVLGPLAGQPNSNHLTRTWTVPSDVDRVTGHMKVRAIGREVLTELVDDGYLDGSVLAQMPTFSLLGDGEWTLADGLGCEQR